MRLPKFPQLALVSVILSALILSGCDSSSIPEGSPSSGIVTGIVYAPDGDDEQFIVTSSTNLNPVPWLAAWVIGTARADVSGLVPVGGATVELVRVSDGAVLLTTTTDQNGAYTFTDTPAIGPGSAFLVRVAGQTDTMRAIVTGGVVDVSPTSEVVVGAVLSSLGGGTALADFMVQEVAALNSVLVSVDANVAGMTFGEAVDAIQTAAGPMFLDLVAEYSAPGTETVLRSGHYSVVDLSGALRDPLVVPEDGAQGGVELDSGQGAMVFGSNNDSPFLGLVTLGKFLHDFTSAQDLTIAGEPANAFPYNVDLGDLLHVVNSKRQIVVADSRQPSVSTAGIGATTASGTLMAYPLDNSVRVDNALSVSGMGIRFATRWQRTGVMAPLLDLNLFDAPGGAGTVYNQVRLQQSLAGEESGANSMVLSTAVGTATFDSTPLSYDFDQPRDYGGFVSNAVTDSLQLNLAGYAVSALSGSDVLSGLYYLPPNGGLVQFRDASVGTLLGWGSVSADGERDGEVVGVNMFSGGFADPVTEVERSFSIAIRRPSGMTAGDASGTYNVVEYAGYLSEGMNGNTPTAFVETGIRHGTVRLNGAGGVTAGSLFHKRATLDVAAARGETGAEPSISGESGTFMTATSGAAGETLALAVGGVTVFSFTSAAAGDAVEAADIQAGLDNATVMSDLLSAGVAVSGTVTGGDLVFSKPDGAAFDIVVTNEFTGTASAAGGFEGADFAIGVHTIDNASPAVPNASGASGAFTTATAGAAGETFALSVDAITLFTFTSTAIGDTVEAADVQDGLNGASGALTAAGFTVSGTVAGGDLVFTRADGAAFTITVINEFTGTQGAAGGFAGTSFQTGTHTITGGTEAVEVVPNASGASGAFTTATAGAAGQTFSLTVGGVEVFTFTSAAIGDTVQAADVQGGLDNATVQSGLATAGITVSGTVAGGDLVFTKADGAAFDIAVTNEFSGTEGAAGGFAGADFATGTHSITNGSEAVPNSSSASGPFTTAMAGAAGQTFALTVGGVQVYTFTSAAIGDTVEAADVQGGLDNATVQNALSTAGITVSGTVAGGNLVFTKTDGAPFTITVINEFSGTEGVAGGFTGADFATGTHTITGGTEAAAAEPNASAPSGPFTTATAGAAGETFALSVDEITVFTFTSAAAGDTVEVADVQGGLNGVSGALTAAGITVSGTVAGGNLVFTRTDGAPFTISVTNEFSGTQGAAGGFAGASFQTGTHTITGGTEAAEAVLNTSAPSGPFTTATAGAAGETFALSVDEITVFTFTSAAAGDTVEAADVQGGLNGVSGALTAAGITVSGTVAGGNLVFTRADGAPFTISVINEFSGTEGVAGGFTGADFATGTHTITGGTEAAAAEPNASAPSGPFTTATAGAAGETFALTVGGVPVFSHTSAAIGDTVEAADVQGGLDNATVQTNLSTAGITVSGTVAGANLVFTKGDGTPFTILVTNTFTGIDGAAGGFAGLSFQAGTNTISGGTQAAAAEPNASAPSGPFTTATAGAAGETFALTVGGVPVFSHTSAAIGDSVEAADVQGGVDAAAAALDAAGITVSGTVAGANLVFTKGDGTPFTILVTNTFTGIDGAEGGFAGGSFQDGTNTISGGTQAADAIPNASGASDTFTTATAGGAGETFALTVGGNPVFSFTSVNIGDTVEAADVQGGVDAAAAALDAAGITVSGTVAGGTLAFTRADGAAFDIVVTNTFTGSAGGFAGADFAPGTHTIDNGAEAVDAVATVSAPSGAFATAIATAAGQSYSLTVGGVGVFSFTSVNIGDTVTAADIDGGIAAAAAALNAAGITVSGTAAGGNLVFSKADGADFSIVVANTFTNTTLSGGSFGGADFAANTPHTIDNGAEAVEAVATVSPPSGAFATATTVAAGQSYALTVGGVPVFSFTSVNIGDTLTAEAIDGGIAAAAAALNAAGITFTGSVAGGNLVFSKADGTDFTIVVVNTFTDTTLSGGGFGGGDFAANTPQTIDNGAEAVEAVATVSAPSGAFTDAVATAAGQGYSLTVGGVGVFSFTSVNIGDTVTAADIDGGIAAAAGALNAAGITVSGTAAGGNLVFSKADGADFTIVVANGFTDTTLSGGGFGGGDFAANTPHAIDNGAEAVEAVATVSAPSGAFAEATAVAVGQTYALTVGGVPVFSFTSVNIGDSVTAAAIDSGIAAAAAALTAAGITASGTAAGGDLVFTKADGTDFAIAVTNTFTNDENSAGGFGGADFAGGSLLIDNGSEAVEAVATVSAPSGAFATATAVAAGQSYALTVGGVQVFSFTSVNIGDTVTAADIDGGITAAAAALNAAGITASGTAAVGDLVFTKADGTDFAILVTNTFTDEENSAGGFGGADFAANVTHDISNGAVAVPTTSTATGAFTTATAVEVGQSYALTVGGVEVFSFTSANIGDTVTAADIDGGIAAAAAALTAAGITVSGTAGVGDLVFTKADGTDFAIVVVNTFTDASNSGGGFAGGDFAGGSLVIDNGTEAVEAVATVSAPSDEFVTATAVAVGQTYVLTVGGVQVFSFTSANIGDTVTAAAIDGGIAAAAAELSAAGITASGTAGVGDLVFTKADGTDFAIVVVNTFTDASNSGGGFDGVDFAGGSLPIDNGAEVGINASGLSGAFETAMAGDAGETVALTVGGVAVFSFTSSAAGDLVTADAIQAALDNPAVQADLAAAGITVTGSVAGGDLAFARDDGAPFDIVVTNGFTGIVSLTGGFAGDDFALGTHTVDNGTLAGPVPSLSSVSGQQSVSTGSYSVQANGEVTMLLTIGDEAIAGSGAATASGDFIALATSSDDGTRKGRGILLLIRQP